MKRLFILIIKTYPILQGIMFILCNIFYLFHGYDHIISIIDYMFGINMISIIVLLVCNYLFHFCAWHRTIIFVNLTCTLIIKSMDILKITLDIYMIN